MERLRKHQEFLHRLLRQRLNRHGCRAEIAKASDAELCAVFELIKNLVHNESLHLQLTDAQRRLLKRHRNQLRQLIDRRVPKGKKRRLLQKGGGVFLPAVLGILGPLIGNLIGSAFKG